MNVQKFKEDIVFQENLRGYNFIFHSTWGLFSYNAIDAGTQLLIDSMHINPSDVVLDLGCGYGAIGIVAAKLAPQGHIHMVDKDFVAVAYAEKNAEANKLKNCEAYLSNGFSHIDPKRTFHVILSNLPSHMSKEVLSIFLSDAKDHLKTGGMISLVIASRLKHFIQISLQDIFGNCEIVAQNKTYIMCTAIKQ
ncbi:MAG TPA: methyltransferase [Patescibacteria group bacterium]|nr:methyltransferase [Patescibacteria group bacterium]